MLVQREPPLVVLPRLSEAAGPQQGHHAVDADLGVPWRALQRRIVGVQRLVEAPLYLQQHAEIAPAECGHRIERHRPLHVRDRGIDITELRAHQAELVMRGRSPGFVVQQRNQRCGGGGQVTRLLQAVRPHQA